MERKSLLFALALTGILIASSGSWANGPVEAEGKGTEMAQGNDKGAVYYTIVRHDTLWDISGRFLNDHFKWPYIWKLNPYIKNPHLIYPGDVVKVIPLEGEEAKRKEGFDVRTLPVLEVQPEEEKEVTVLEPEAPATAPAPAPPPPSVSSSSIPRKGFVSRHMLESSGEIIGSRHEKMLFIEGDNVFISFKDRGSVEAGQRYTVYNASRKVMHPESGKRVGYMVDILGSLVVTVVSDAAEARVENSFKEMEVGAKLMPYAEPVTEVEMTEAEAEVSGYIVASLEDSGNFSKGDIVYIDRGTDHGLKDGNVMSIYREGDKVRDPVGGKGIKLPSEDLGELVVISAEKDTSACIIIRSVRDIRAGDRVSTAGMK